MSCWARMNRPWFRSLIAVVALTVLSGLAIADPAAGRVVTRKYTSGAAIEGRYVYLATQIRRASRIVRVGIDTGVSEVIYTAPAGRYVRGVNSGGGWLSFGLIKPGPDEQPELGQTWWMALSIGAAPGTQPTQIAYDDGFTDRNVCYKVFGFPRVDDDGTMFYNEGAAMSFPGGECGAGKFRISAHLYSPTAQADSVIDTVEEWLGNDEFWEMTQVRFLFEVPVVDVSGDWFVATDRFFDGNIRLTNWKTHESWDTGIDGDPGDLKVLPDGHALLTAELDSDLKGVPEESVFVIPDIRGSEPRAIGFRSKRSQMSFCGDEIVELYDRPWSMRGKRRWRMRAIVRDRNGRVVRALPKLIPGNSYVRDCDEDTMLVANPYMSLLMIDEPTFLMTVPLR